MEKFIIEGGKKLSGDVHISGSKNASLPIMAACILSDERCELENVPDLRDVTTMSKVLETLGMKIEKDKDKLLITPTVSSFIAPYELVKTMRASIYVLGALLGKYGKAKVSMPGGCIIGQRPIDLHIKGFKQMGAKINFEKGYIIAETKKLTGTEIYLDVVSVGATINIMLAAVLAKGITVIRNAALEPHVVDTANFLNTLGAKIKGHGTNEIVIEGVRRLKGKKYRIIPDYIEAGTYLIAGAITKGNIKIDYYDGISTLISKLKLTGANIIEENNGLRITCNKRVNSVDITTAPYPGFPTDLQAQWMALMSIANGISVITETIWENRFIHASELIRMGADIKIERNTAVVKGVKNLYGTRVMVSDLRAGASLVLAGLCAKGKTEISRIYHLDRGYERIEDKLQKLGARIKRVKE
jgi:UDP-N-acetylglucosamine 1-carboxyvinyltransferase